jgi:hypothetical protein
MGKNVTLDLNFWLLDGFREFRAEQQRRRAC